MRGRAVLIAAAVALGAACGTDADDPGATGTGAREQAASDRPVPAAPPGRTGRAPGSRPASGPCAGAAADLPSPRRDGWETVRAAAARAEAQVRRERTGLPRARRRDAARRALARTLAVRATFLRRIQYAAVRRDASAFRIVRGTLAIADRRAAREARRARIAGCPRRVR